MEKPREQRVEGLEDLSTLYEKTTTPKKRFPAWTGFNDKTLWDGLQLASSLMVPLLLGILTFNQSQNALKQEENNQKRNEDNQQSKILSEYLDEMSKYLVEKPKNEDIVKINSVARAKTLIALRQIDPERKGQLLKFLYESDLIKPCETGSAEYNCGRSSASSFNINGAKMDEVSFEEPPPIMQKAYLYGVKLPRAKLSAIDLTGAILETAILTGADLSKATFDNANMKKVLLIKSKANGAYFIGANLTDAILDNADLSEADLRGADLTGASLNQTDLKKALYNKREDTRFKPSLKPTVFPKNFNPQDAGMILKEDPTQIQK